MVSRRSKLPDNSADRLHWLLQAAKRSSRATPAIRGPCLHLLFRLTL